MQAVLLAAGVGKRLAPYTQVLPKCLLEVEGETLLERHLRTYVSTGIREAIIVTGYLSEHIRDFVESLELPLPIKWVFNRDFRQGSIVSLKSGLAEAHDDVIFMDADVYYSPALFERLLKSSHPNCVLIDTRSSETGEEMMIGVREGRAMSIARRLDANTKYDLSGESVGFFKVSKQHRSLLQTVIDQTIYEQGSDIEYETAVDRFLTIAEVGFERVDDFAWTEIDFEQDLTRAREVIAPALKETVT